MRTWFLLALVLFFSYGSPALGADEPDADKLAKAREQVYNLCNGRAGRSNGVKLDASVSVDPTKDKVTIDWSLDYEGQRPPLIIIKPTLTGATKGQTELLVYAEGKDGKLYGRTLTSPEPTGVWGSALDEKGRLIPMNEFFITVETGKSGKGATEFSAKEVGDYFRRTSPEQFDEKPAPMRVQLIHQPRDRGNYVTPQLDAWTGTVNSKLVEVHLKKW